MGTHLTCHSKTTIVNKKPRIESRQKAKYGLPDDLRHTDVGSHLSGPLATFRRRRACSSKENSKKSKVQCIRYEVPLCAVPYLAEFIRHSKALFK